METKVGQTRLVLVRGDITEQATDAIVNAANTTLLGGGGVDGAIHHRGGPTILEVCQRIGGARTGEAVITRGGKLPARFVIHAVGPFWSGGARGEDALLASAYRASLRIAAERKLRSVAFPSIDGHDLEEVRLVLFTDSDLGVYERALTRTISGGRLEP